MNCEGRFTCQHNQYLHETLQSTWEEALTITTDTKAKARMQGISA